VGCCITFPELLAGLGGIPDTLWAAIVAAGIAFFSSCLSNKNSGRQLQMQLDQNARQQDPDRAISLRRDARLPAVEAIVRTQSLLGEITDRNADHTALARQMIRDSGAIAKINLVGNQATVRAVMSYLQALMPAYVELLKSRAELHVRKHAIATEQPFMDGADSEIPRHVQLMKQNNLAGSTDTQLRERLNRQF
jgi:hypothetical protein